MRDRLVCKRFNYVIFIEDSCAVTILVSKV